jgi:hypothetical protein
LRSIRLTEKSLGPANLTRTRELTEFGSSNAMPAGITVYNAARGALCLALENRAVGGKSKSGATTITSTTAINRKPTTLDQRFTVITRANSTLRHMSFVKSREAGQFGRCLRLLYRRQQRSGTGAGWLVTAISPSCCVRGSDASSRHEQLSRRSRT